MKKAPPIPSKKFKVSVIGCGSVGATAAYAMFLDGTPAELVLIDIDNRAQGLLMDLKHCLSYVPFTNLHASSDLKATSNSDLIIVTAGVRQQDGQSRLDLIKENKKIFKELIPALAQYSPNSIFVIVSNPVDILTYEALKLSKFPRNRVFGTGTMLDTSRLQFHISERIKVNPHDIQAYILGEHGDTSFPVWSSANIGGKSLFQFSKFSQKIADQCYDDTRNAAYRIIHDMGFTCYSIATVIREIMRMISQDSHNVIPLSIALNGEYGLNKVALSVPCILGANGIEEIIEIPLNTKEKKLLKKSMDTIKKYL